MKPSQRQPTELQKEIIRALQNGHRTAQDLIDRLGTSQATLSRSIRELSSQVTMFRVQGTRTPHYALLRPLPMGLNSRQRIYRFMSKGNIVPFAEVEFLMGGGTLERTDASSTGGSDTYLYEGLPPYMLFASPSGFLGRQTAHDVAQGQPFPSSLKDWNDDHRVAYLFTQGLNLPGNLVFGDKSLQSEMNLREQAPVASNGKLAHYSAMARHLKNASYGSSAGGEQPKFLSHTQTDGSVIVKFAKLGSRMADLLPMEHLALRCLAEVDVPSATTQLLADEEYVFLEIARFDRSAEGGRVGMLSAGSVDDEFFGMRDSWPEFAARCLHAGYLSKADATHVLVMAAFSELIGNTDRHFENISMLIGEDGEYQGIAPAYDILPMRYASIGGGIDPELLPIEPKVSTIGAVPEVWDRAMRAAEKFWLAVGKEALTAPISDEFKQLASQNLAVARRFAAPLLPA